MMKITDVSCFGAGDYPFRHIGAGRGDDQIILRKIKAFPDPRRDKAERRIDIFKKWKLVCPGGDYIPASKMLLLTT